MSLDLPVPETEEVVEADLPQAPVLFRAVKLRFPEFSAEVSARERVDMLEQHIWETANMRGELAELRLSAHTELRSCRRQWDHMQGWEQHRKGDRTEASVERAKRKASPGLWDSMENARWTIERCTEEMKRMDADYEAASRAYTLLAG